ncbi:MAG TPA: hypothetical protein VFF06_09345 [Polyangia bacterium]|nr:hypothetical protein [Polyangia bacterium]
MMLPIVKHVMPRPRRLRRRPQNHRVITIRQHFAAPPHQSIERNRHSHVQSLHTARKRSRPFRLDEQMNVIALHRIMNQPKSKPRIGRTKHLL